LNATTLRRSALPLTEAQRKVMAVLARGARTTDEVAAAAGLTRDGARSVLMALSSKNRVIHHRGKPARWERA
jgi:hypothetical protein